MFEINYVLSDYKHTTKAFFGSSFRRDRSPSDNYFCRKGTFIVHSRKALT